MLRNCWLSDGVDAAILARLRTDGLPTIEFVVIRNDIEMGEGEGSNRIDYEVVDAANGQLRIEKYRKGELLTAPKTSIQTLSPCDPGINALAGKSIMLAEYNSEYHMFLVGDRELIKIAPTAERGIVWTFLRACTKYYL